MDGGSEMGGTRVWTARNIETSTVKSICEQDQKSIRKYQSSIIFSFHHSPIPLSSESVPISAVSADNIVNYYLHHG